MQISIEYCDTCNYRPRAAVLSRALREAFGVTPFLFRTTETGVFRIAVDGEPVYSKFTAAAFPTKDELIAILREQRNSVCRSAVRRLSWTGRTSGPENS